MNTLRDAAFLLRQWWKRHTGQMESRLLSELNANITDPEWWSRRPAASYVHPLRCRSYAREAEIICAFVDEDETLSQRRESIVRQWYLARHFTTQTGEVEA